MKIGLGACVQLAFDFFSPSPREPERARHGQDAPPRELTPKALQPTNLFKGGQPALPPCTRLEYVHPQANRVLEWHQARIHYCLKRSARRTIGMMVTPKGLEVAAPKWVSVAQILEALTEKQAWILRQLSAMRQRTMELSAHRLPLASPLILPFMGLPLEVVLSSNEADPNVSTTTLTPSLPRQRKRSTPTALEQCLARAQLMHRGASAWQACSPADLMAMVQGSLGDALQSENLGGGDIMNHHNDNSHVRATPFWRLVLPWESGAMDRPILIEDLTDANKVRLADLVAMWMSSWALDVLKMRVAYFAPLLGVSWTKIKLSRSASRWGSANARGELAFNRHLVHVGMPLLDYVVVHELSHFKHMNHSPAFWGVVEAVMPDYDWRRAMLQKTPMPDWQAWDALRTA